MSMCNCYRLDCRLREAVKQDLSVAVVHVIAFYWYVLAKKSESESKSALQVLQRKQSMCHRFPAEISLGTTLTRPEQAYCHLPRSNALPSCNI